jgi:predicted membrane protein
MTDDKEKYVGRTSGRIGAGIFLLLIGSVLLLDQMGVPLPHWLFSWHLLLIAIGIFIGLRHGFRGGAWMVMILVGAYFLAQDYYPDLPWRRFIWPGALIFLGLIIIMSPHRHGRRQWRYERGEDWGSHRWNRRYTQSFATSREGFSSEDFIDTTAVFGGVHKKVVSKNFKGGDITTIMGGTELDLTQADFTGVVRLDVTQIMGGTKIIVPPHWEVRSEVSAVFAGFEDKRQQSAVTNPEKVLILDGTSFFGGIELKNY